MTKPADNQQRIAALDPTRSFIVQAPAGSGKTGLLVRRYLTLLARVAEPEEILAITFTRKATAEMRHRILHALAGKDADMKELAVAALANDQRLGWNILANPGRLRIQTIDAFCYELVGRMPWSARFGAAPNLLAEQQVELACLQAAKRTLDHIEEPATKGSATKAHDNWSGHCANLLKLLDANFGKAQSVLASMLHKRDRWMRGLEVSTRAQYEIMWQQVIEQQLEDAYQRIPEQMKTEIVALTQFAATNPYETSLSKTGHNVDLIGCLHMEGFPQPLIENLGYWRGIAALILTNQLTVRKMVDVRLGFPPNRKAEKERMKSLLESMADEGNALQALSKIPLLPTSNFTDKQWQALQSLLALLPLAAAELRLIYKENNQADYIEVAQRAEMALGDGAGDDVGEFESPSELALVLDYQLKHVLMDEVQDTSRAQIELLKKLTRGWQHDDGRTLFFVGDPMQSIYRFREAEVANFLSIQENGIGDIKPQTLTLETNFRSTASLVDWCNRIFPTVFPAQDDIINSAVHYSPSVACRNFHEGGVYIHAGIKGSRESEATRICVQVKDELVQNPDAKIGILGRSRSHLVAITQVLREHEVEFQAIELESLIERSAIQDLMALTRGLIQLSDRIAWLSILRAPWCGMTLEDLSALAMDDHQRTLMELSADDKITAHLSEDGLQRLGKLRQALEIPLSQRGRVSLRKNIEAAWLNLSAPACIDHADIADCESYFDLLSKLENEDTHITASSLSAAVSRAWSRADSEAKVQVLTIHKSKGLEFDVVILPQLHRSTRASDRELIRWTRLPEQLLIAVLPHSDAQDDKHYQYLGDLEQFRQHNELCRLLYVACTRARNKLHLYMDVSMSSPKDGQEEGEIKLPRQNSLLDLLWGALQTEIRQNLPATGESDAHATPEAALLLTDCQRLPLKWQPDIPLGVTSDQQAHAKAEETHIEFSWAGETARIVGIVIHNMLEHIDQQNWRQWKSEDAETLLSRNRIALMDNGLYGEQLEIGMTSLRTAIDNLKSDSKADWIFSSSHTQAKREWALTAAVDKMFYSVVIDRSFIDQDGICWIVDFKSSQHQGGDIEQFIAHEKTRYQQQLEHYAHIVSMIAEGREIKLGLYFPLLKGWCEWSPDL